MYNISMEYKSNHNITYSCKYHVVFCPKYHRKVLVDGVDTRLKELITERKWLCMTTMRGYKYRIYPDEKQANLINRTLGCCRFVYNHFLAVRRDEWNANHRGLYYKQTNLLLTELKRRDETCWLREVDSMALQESLRNLDDAYARFFKKQTRYPRFKFKHNHTQSYRTRNQSNGIRFENGNLKLPKVGLVRIRLSRAFEGKIKHVTVSRTASGKYFVSLCVEENASFAPCGKGQIGIDVGLKEFYSDSNGNTVGNPHLLRRFQKKLRREQRRLSRKMPQSHNRDKQRVRVARVHEHIKNIRRDFQQKLTTQLINENQVIAVEHLKIKNMLKNKKLAKSISDASWYEFIRELEYKAAWRGARILKVDTFYPSSQTCGTCGYKNPLVKNLAVREWDCPQCGAHHDRDVNAAQNILKKALEQVA